MLTQRHGGTRSLPILFVGGDEPLVASARATLVPRVAADLVATPSVAGALGILADQQVACVIIDMEGPGTGSASEVQRIIDAHPLCALVAVIPDDDPESGLELVRRGAQGYVVRSELDRPMLPRVVHASIKRAEVQVELARREALHRAVLDALHEGLVLQESDGSIIEANPAAQRILGLSEPQLVDRSGTDPRWQAVDDTGEPLADQAFPWLRALTTGEPVTGILMGVSTPDGVRRWIEVNSIPINDPADPLRRQVATSFSDVTARRSTLEQLRLQASMLDMVGQAVVVTDAHRLVRYWNRSAARILGWNADEAIGRAVDSLLAPPSSDAPTARLGDVLERSGGDTWHGDLTICGRDGAARTLLTTVSPVSDIAGAITGQIAVLTDITERKTAEEELAHTALHDGLTGLPNRTLLHDRLQQALARAGRKGSQVAVLFIDLDGFKDLNDRLGHLAGDDVLVESARRLRTVLRPDDTLARFGGDEMVAVCQVGDALAAHRVGSRLLRAIRDPFQLGAHEATISASIGLVVARPDDDPAALLRRADAAMYRAKREGGDRIDEAHPSSPQSRAAPVQDAELVRALERNELRVVFLPLLSLPTRAPLAIEALVRWHHPGQGVLLPGGFLPLAEEAGVMVSIERWVLTEALRQRRRWCDALGAARCVPPVAVNLSEAALVREHAIPGVMQALTDAGMEPTDLVLDVAESALLGAPAVVRTVASLRALGVSTHLDDFGTSGMGIGHLAALDVAALKVDRSIIAAADTDPHCRRVAIRRKDAKGFKVICMILDKVQRCLVECLEKINAKLYVCLETFRG